ncbi:hypothetical protein CYLTODRAFT_15119 [Cylindrobasidium torrendii FP15055 ss-10]|uniref:CBD9-like protein n=1 Tax=Cylindrobasidium torrendii FP15055 ss-10 TaxID=1314674 RepID=A0A0D7B923_9AGAR|nr:hypothetical protein CYLTODRAFT_15119 [Cylindrobasidium torrendii FP15055 ss-10]
MFPTGLALCLLSLLTVGVAAQHNHDRNIALYGRAGNATTRGSRQCSNYMCVTATVNSSTIQYELSGTGRREPGWMAVGFGESMIGSPMVILWANSDGSVTLSQRSASGYSEPTVTSNPDRVATLVENATAAAAGSNAAYSFTMDVGSTSGLQTIIYAFGVTAPSSSATDASIQQHLAQGSFVLNLDGSLNSSGSGSGSGSATNDIPLTQPQRMFVAHAILCIVGFLFFLPLGSLLARYARTFTEKWFLSHWVVQWVLAGTCIVAGFALGVAGVSRVGAPHFTNTHSKLGLALFILWLIQCTLGALIHFVKPKFSLRRPPQNYVHAVIGLSIIAIAFYQVRLGYRTTWPLVTGRGAVGKGADIVWYIWVVLVPLAYIAGLALLPKQFRQESERRRARGGYTQGGKHAAYSDADGTTEMSHTNLVTRPQRV